MPAKNVGGQRPFWGSDDSATPILHVDMDSFFAAVEVRENPELAGRPVIVGGLGARGVVTSATYQARPFGVRAGMPIARARALCPQAVFLGGRHHIYSEYSKRVMEILGTVTPDVEPLSIDEAFLDVSGARRRLGSPRQIAEILRSEIKEQLGLPASVGIASTKSVAKIASGLAKPDGVLLVPAEVTVDFLHSLPVGALWGVGKTTEEKLFQRGIVTTKDLAETPVAELARILGVASAHHLHDLAWGLDARVVGTAAREKSISTERTFETNLTTHEDLGVHALDAAHKCASRMREAGLLAWTVNLKLRGADFKTITRAKTLFAPTDVGQTIAEAALGLLRAERIPAGGVRLLGVGVSSLVGADQGVPVALDQDERRRESEVVMDAAGKRFGKKALFPATLIKASKDDRS